MRVQAEQSKRKVFKRGRPKGEQVLRPAGGQSLPSSTAGEEEECKYAQKNLKKKKTSEIMNRTMPYRKPDLTFKEWYPK